MDKNKGFADDDIAELQIEAARRKKRLGKVNLCEDCGQPTENIGYCDECELRHEFVFGNIERD